jgi:hypothetical protein
VVRIPDEYDPSPVQEMLRDKGLDVEIESPDELGFEDDMFELMELSLTGDGSYSSGILTTAPSGVFSFSRILILYVSELIANDGYSPSDQLQM